MSSSIAKFRKKDKRFRKTPRGDGRAGAGLPTPRGRQHPQPEGDPDFSTADPGCRHCHGTGQLGELTQGGRRTNVICGCVARGMTGVAPWLRRTVRK